MRATLLIMLMLAAICVVGVATSDHKKPKEIVHVIHAAPILENKTNYVTVTNVITDSKFSTKGCTFFMGPKRYYMIDSHGKEHDL